MFVLHGIFGMGTNFRAIAKAAAAREPSWGFVLVDQRGHGASQGFAPPHDLNAAARDLEALADHLARTKGIEVRGVLGHSFGGKVALAYIERRPVDVAVLLDSQPGPRILGEETDSAANVLVTLEALDHGWEKREAFSEALRDAGYSAGLIEWLTMNVRRDGDLYRLRLDLPAIRSMLEDYFARDLWHVVEQPEFARTMSLVIAARSTVFDDVSRARADAAAFANPVLTVVVVENAGHWIHVDAPSKVLDALCDALAR
ncbi:MAG: alpha/beta hydrolase [Polyangiaceae bacterium]|nr:alpha/beta hydrolase [Polyangiaceae bacterium]